MTAGPGKYDDLCTYVREKSEAGAAVVIVLGGKHGHGFSVQVYGGYEIQLAETLEDLARQLRGDIGNVH